MLNIRRIFSVLRQPELTSWCRWVASVDGTTSAGWVRFPFNACPVPGIYHHT